MKNYIFNLVLAFCAFSGISSGQVYVLSPDVIAVSGGVEENAGYILSWTTGEVVIETLDNGTHMLTQGFQQPDIPSVTHVIEIDKLDLSIQVYPNPTSNHFLVEIDKLVDDLHAILIDQTGKKLIDRVIVNQYEQFNVTDLASGMYYLQFFYGSDLLSSVKLVIGGT